MCGSLAEVRARAADAEGLAEQLVQSLAPCIRLLNEYTSTGTSAESKSPLRDEASKIRIRTAPPASEFEVDAIVEFAKILFGVDLQAKVVRLPEETFFNKHVRVSYYLTQIAKCDDQDCNQSVFQRDLVFLKWRR